MIGSVVANLTFSRGAGDLGGRAKAGMMGVMGGWRGWGVLGTDEQGVPELGIRIDVGGTWIVIAGGGRRTPGTTTDPGAG